MLGRTASNLFWMSRYIERAENIARLTEVGYRISMTPDTGSGHREDWKSTLIAAGCLEAFLKRHQTLSTRPRFVAVWKPRATMAAPCAPA